MGQIFRNVFIVEDNPVDATVIKAIVEQLGHRATVFTNAHEAIAELEKQIVDLFILDWQLPHVSGFDFLRTLKHHDDWRKISIVMMSGKNEIKHVKMAIAEGADDYIIKPIDPMIAKTKVTNILQKRLDWVFHQVPAENPAQSGCLSQEIRVVSLCEVGVEILVNHNVAVGSILGLKIAGLGDADESEMQMRSYECAPAPKNPGFWLVRGAFIGLRDGELKKIRLLINTFRPLANVVSKVG